MTRLYIDDIDRKRIVTKWVEFSLYLLHGWATALIISISRGVNNITISAALSTVTFGIAATIGILLADKFFDILALVAERWFGKGSVPLETTETITRTVTPSTTPAADVKIDAENVEVKDAP